ncbi:hypothetical protein M0802_011876 [Mischocyttarus mexicanus]|nr:hypothetical protein M0802_011876 [Mischocyttarus mexicanus]
MVLSARLTKRLEEHTCKDFRCTQNEFCIETDLLCDGVNHCGDGSDEAPSTHCASQIGAQGLSKSLKNSGLFPSTFNVAAKAEIFVNATCGEDGPETFCKPSESSRCAVCDSRSPDPGKRHNISHALDSNPSKWWQSPTLARGDNYEYVTIILDLKQHQECECERHTCGERCEKCCPMYNQIPWRPGTASKGFHCEKCNCNGHATSCLYDPEVADKRMSMDSRGKFRGGGVCLNCTEHTSGINCEKCQIGYYRPNGVSPDAPEPCLPCDCSIHGSTGYCTPDDSYTHLGKVAGACECKSGYSGYKCDQCAAGYRQYPYCMKCPCDSRGILPSHDCEGDCICKANVDGEFCDKCKPGYFAMTKDNLDGCVSCYCFGATDQCSSTKLYYTMGNNGMRIAYGEEQYNGQEAEISVSLTEEGWYHVRTEIRDIPTRLKRTDFRGDPVNRKQMIHVLADLKYLLIRTQYHSEQIEGSLLSAILPVGEPTRSEDGSESLVEMCDCPEGYTGLSCETCSWGYVKVTKNGSDHRDYHICVECDCNGHAGSCDLVMGECKICEHHTIGPKCDRCTTGYYGIATKGTQEDCKKCACPLSIESNNFSPSCQLEDPTDDNSGYVCTQCPEGYTGDHCESCDVGYYGNPSTPGGICERCPCSGGPCDQETGRCLECRGNTEGWKCERCKEAHYGDPLRQNCLSCDCDPIGSSSVHCDRISGQCPCNPLFSGRDCSFCVEGYGNVSAGCQVCDCKVGALNELCDPVTGQCRCTEGVVGSRCDRCDIDHYGLSINGCQGK